MNNIMIKGNGGVLIDFDLACKLEQQGLRLRRSGTLNLMAIRVLQGEGDYTQLLILLSGGDFTVAKSDRLQVQQRRVHVRA